jgi:hypothetical protein
MADRATRISFFRRVGKHLAFDALVCKSVWAPKSFLTIVHRECGSIHCHYFQYEIRSDTCVYAFDGWNDVWKAWGRIPIPCGIAWKKVPASVWNYVKCSDIIRWYYWHALFRVRFEKRLLLHVGWFRLVADLLIRQLLDARIAGILFAQRDVERRRASLAVYGRS